VKAIILIFAITWMRNEVEYVTDPMYPLLKGVACENNKGIQAGVIYAGIDRQTISESVKADTVQVTESFAEGSVEVSEFEQIARAFIGPLDLQPKGLGFGVFLA